MLERLTPRIGTARAARGGRSAGVPVTCFAPCTVKLRSGRATRSYRLTAGRTRTLRVRLGDRHRLTVRIGSERRALRVR